MLKTPHIIFRGDDNISRPTKATMKPAETLASIVTIFFSSIFAFSFLQEKNEDNPILS